MAINDKNIFPYYDDFKEDKNFYQILFRPGFSVQARELTQLQSILQDQIKKFGNHIFKDGSIVIPGNSFFDLETSYVKVTAPTVDIAQFEGNVMVGSTSGVKAQVRKVLTSTNNDPTTLYLSYISGGTNGENVFLNNENIFVEGRPTSNLTTASIQATGLGSMAFVNRGVYYVSGTFVSVEAQSIVISKYDSLPTGSVVLTINENIVTSFEDESLLDPSQGSNNFAAPGADRLKISLILEYITDLTNSTKNTIELARFEAGILLEHARYARYSELEKSLARRTYDESGDYIVNGLKTTIREHLKDGANGGRFPSPTGDRNKFVATLSSGKAYITGFETEKIANTEFYLDKARDDAHTKSETNNVIRPDYGQTLLVSNLINLPNFSIFQTVNLFNTSATSGGTLVGTAKVYAIDYVAGDPASVNAIHKIYLTDISFEAGFSQKDIGGIRYTTGSMSVIQLFTVPGTVTDFTVGETVSYNAGIREGVVHRWDRSSSSLYLRKANALKDTPQIGDVIVGGTSMTNGVVQDITYVMSSPQNSLIFPVTNNSLRSLRSLGGAADIRYMSWKKLTIVTDGSGNGSATVTDGSIMPLEVGSFLAVGATGNVSIDDFTLDVNGNVLTLIGGPISSTVHVFTIVEKENLIEKTKSKLTTSISIPTPTAKMSLGKADIIKINSIISGGVDVTSLFKLDNGQKDYYYDVGFITLKGGATLPTSAVVVNFDYFQHSANGDYFTVDSYTTLGPSYLDSIPTYTSKSTNTNVLLKNSIDFRPRVGDNGSFGTLGGSLSDVVTNQTRIISNIQFFVGRIDTVYMNKNSKVEVLSGVPSQKPLKPTLPNDGIYLANIYIPPYTTSIKDIGVSNNTNTRYTMADISKLEDRVFNLEYFSTLSASESSVIDFNILDAATGLSRFKTGYIIDSFGKETSGDSIADIFSKDFSVSHIGTAITAGGEAVEVPLLFSQDSSFFRETKDLITLPYTEVKMVEQPLSTRITNVNPFAVFSWVGNMTLTPNIDYIDENLSLPDVFVNETVTVEEIVVIPLPPPPPAPPPLPPPNPRPPNPVIPPPPPAPSQPPPPATVDWPMQYEPYNPPISQPQPPVRQPIVYTASVTLDPYNNGGGLAYGQYDTSGYGLLLPNEVVNIPGANDYATVSLNDNGTLSGQYSINTANSGDTTVHGSYSNVTFGYEGASANSIIAAALSAGFYPPGAVEAAIASGDIAANLGLLSTALAAGFGDQISGGNVGQSRDANINTLFSYPTGISEFT